MRTAALWYPNSFCMSHWFGQSSWQHPKMSTFWQLCLKCVWKPQVVTGTDSVFWELFLCMKYTFISLGCSFMSFQRFIWLSLFETVAPWNNHAPSKMFSSVGICLQQCDITSVKLPGDMLGFLPDLKLRFRQFSEAS